MGLEKGLALDVVHGLEADHLSNAEDQEPRRDRDQGVDDGGPQLTKMNKNHFNLIDFRDARSRTGRLPPGARHYLSSSPIPKKRHKSYSSRLLQVLPCLLDGDSSY